MGRSATGREDYTSPSSRGYFSPGQFDILVSDSGYESDKVELSAAAIKSPVIAKFDQSNYTMEPKSGAITSRDEPSAEGIRTWPSTADNKPSTTDNEPRMLHYDA